MGRKTIKLTLICLLFIGLHGLCSSFDDLYFSDQVGLGGSVTNYVENGTNFTAHIFTEDGTFFPRGSKTCDLLIVGGGGGGGSCDGNAYSVSGVGCAGGEVVLHQQFVYESLSVVVGSGGDSDNNGSASAVTGFTNAIGGGAGGSANGIADAGSTGASGGGGGYFGGGGASGGIGTQGNNGSSGFSSTQGNSGGGGGASANAADSSSLGGAGIINSFSGISKTYAAGGDGTSSNDGSSPDSGTANSGNGGDGLGKSGLGGSGGSGIVIIRYEK